MSPLMLLITIVMARFEASSSHSSTSMYSHLHTAYLVVTGYHTPRRWGVFSCIVIYTDDVVGCLGIHCKAS